MSQERREIDARSRARATSELRRSFVVEAGAGTGKTTTLVERFVNLVLDGADVESLAAITFTEKAAAELKGRVRARLEQRAIELSGEAAARVREAIERLETASVTTIHGFCARILREFAVEARIDPGFEIVEGERDEVLRDRAFERFLAGLTADDERAVLAAFESGVTVKELGQVCRRLADHRDVSEIESAYPDPGPSPDPAPVLAAFRSAVEWMSARKSQCIDRDDAGFAHIEELERVAASGELPRAADLKQKGNQNNWRPKTTITEIKREVAATALLLSGHEAAVAHHRAANLLRAARSYLAIHRAVKREDGVLDFNDLLVLTRDLLKHDLRVRALLKARFRTLLVDEFQDTDPMQVEIVFFLAESPGASANEWSDVEVGAGRLFLVGDPKQSIYRFRRADIAVYESAKARVVACGGEQLAIFVTNRSVASIVEWVNPAFEAALAPARVAPALQAEHVPLLAASGKPDAPPGVIVLKHAADAPPLENAEAARAAEARAVVGWIAKRRAAGESGSVAILFRSARRSFELYENALRDHSVPYRVAGGKQLYSRAEIKAAVALFRAIDDPRDGIAVIAALRSPLFGISDVDLVAFRAAGGAFDATTPPPSTSPPTVRAALGLLADLRARKHAGDLATAVEHALDRTHAFDLFLLKPNGEQRVANLRKLVEIARDLDRAERRTFRTFVERLREMESSGEEDEESPLVDEAKDAVQLMTMHKSKGLDFDAVVIADLGLQQKHPDRLLITRSPAPAIAYGAGEKRSFATSNFADVERSEALCEDAETARLLYVAATRAKRMLVLPHFIPGRAIDRRQKLATALADAPRFAAPLVRDDDRFVDAATVDPGPPTARAFRLSIDPDGPLPASAAASLEERKRFLREAHDRFTDAAPHRRAVTSASRMKHAVDFAPLAASGVHRARATSFGVLVHRLLETVDLAPPRAAATGSNAGALARSLGLDAAAAQDATALVARTLASPLGERLRAARRVIREAPFVFEKDGALIEGAIDLIAEERDGGLVIVDWKTDDVAGAALDERFATYRLQGELYRAALARASGVDRIEVLFAFVRAGVVRAL